MKTTIFTLFLMVFYSSLSGQVNLVPNHSFEDYNQCPDGSLPMGVWNPVPWNQDPIWSSDYFNVCGSNGYTVPHNFLGWQYPQDSNAYVGIGVFVHPSLSPEYREYIQVQLLDTLKAGRAYCVSFFVSVGDTINYGVTNVCAYFSPSPGGMNPATYYTYQPQVCNPDSNYLLDKDAWAKVSGSFVATGNERYMIIGNFKPDSLTNYQIADSSDLEPGGAWLAYYYIDNVSVIEMQSAIAGASSLLCSGDSTQLGTSAGGGVNYSWSPSDGLSDTTISNPLASPTVTTTYTLTQIECDAVQTATVTITVQTDCDTPSVFFIPTLLSGGQAFEISGLTENSHLTIYDLRGRRVYYSENYQNDFRADSVAEGQYIIELVTPEGERIKQKLIVTR